MLHFCFMLWLGNMRIVHLHAVETERGPVFTIFVLLYFYGRPIMSKLINVDIFSPGLDQCVDIQHPVDCSFMIAFLNIAEHHSVMTPAGENRLTSVLDLIANNMHDNGTVVIALPNFEFELTRLKGDCSSNDKQRS